MHKLENHPVADIFPMMDEEEYKQLVEDIREHGQREKIVLLDGKILDGRNRYRACLELGIAPDFAELAAGEDPLAYVLSVNTKRRHLTKAQLAIVAARSKPFFDRAAKEKQQDAGKNFGRGKQPKKSSDDVGKAARDAAGAALGVSGRYVDLASKITVNGSKDLQAAVEAGVIPLARAAKLAELPEPEQVAAMRAPVKRNRPQGKPDRTPPAKPAVQDVTEAESTDAVDNQLASADQFMARIDEAAGWLKACGLENAWQTWSRDQRRDAGTKLAELSQLCQEQCTALTRGLDGNSAADANAAKSFPVKNRDGKWCVILPDGTAESHSAKRHAEQQSRRYRQQAKDDPEFLNDFVAAGDGGATA